MTVTAGNTTTTTNGGAIEVLGAGSLTLTDSAVTNSHTTAYGGGIFADGPLTLTRVTVSGNKGDAGAGGIGAGVSGVVQIDASTITGNQVSGSSGGGIGLFNNEAGPDATIKNTTISGNTTASTGGGIKYAGHSLTLDPATGTVSGAAPMMSGSYPFTLTVTDSGNTTASHAHTIIVGVPNAMPQAQETVAASGIVPATAPATHTPGVTGGTGAGTPTPLPQPVRH